MVVALRTTGRTGIAGLRGGPAAGAAWRRPLRSRSGDGLSQPDPGPGRWARADRGAGDRRPAGDRLPAAESASPAPSSPRWRWGPPGGSGSMRASARSWSPAASSPLCRNPIYTFMVIAWLGFALLVPTWLSLASIPVGVVAFEVQVRLVEEPHLLRAHREAYREWASRVGRFVPGLGRIGRPDIAACRAIRPPRASSTWPSSRRSLSPWPRRQPPQRPHWLPPPYPRQPVPAKGPKRPRLAQAHAPIASDRSGALGVPERLRPRSTPRRASANRAVRQASASPPLPIASR